MEIDIKKLKESELFVEEFLLLLFIHNELNFEEFKWWYIPVKGTLSTLEENLWIKKVEDGYVLRDRGRKLFENEETTTFEQFWEHYHVITKLPKTDKAAAETKWKRLKPKEKEKAIQMVESYYNSLNDKKYCRKARTYLENKNFNDEFKRSGIQTSRVIAK